MDVGIVNRSKPAWFCQRCKDESSIIYYTKGNKYCEKCVPDDVKANAILVNQIRKPIERR